MKARFLEQILVKIYNTIYKMEVLKKIWGYMTFRKNTGEGSFLKSMHIINKISIFMFLIAMIILVVKLTR